MLYATENIFLNIKSDEISKRTFEYYLQKSFDRLNSIKGITRNKRSIDWIGSAWKWIAGNPDAADWNQVLGRQEKLVENNEHQYVVNNKLFETTNNLVKQVNKLTQDVKNKISETESENIAKESLNQLLVIKEDIEEVVRACQLAKSGVINTNLLDMVEISKIVSELESLPYNNEIEAIEYGRPSVFSNGTSLLYVLSIPKVNLEKYDMVILKAAILKNRQLDLKYKTALLNNENIYGITDSCSKTNNMAICTPNQLQELKDEDCLLRILRSSKAHCTFLSNQETIIEQIEDDLIFVSNFKGMIFSSKNNISLNGTFVVKISNETIEIGNKKFINERISNIQALPPLLANVYEKDRKLDVNLLQELHEKNIKQIRHLQNHVNLSFWSQITGYLFIIITAIATTHLWKKIFGPIRLPAPSSPENTVG